MQNQARRPHCCCTLIFQGNSDVRSISKLELDGLDFDHKELRESVSSRHTIESALERVSGEYQMTRTKTEFPRNLERLVKCTAV